MIEDRLILNSCQCLKHAEDDLDTAKINYAAGKYKAAANRAYYSV